MYLNKTAPQNNAAEASELNKVPAAQVVADPGLPNVVISIFDTQYNVVTESVGRLKTDLAPGIYKVRYSTGSTTEDVLFEVSRGQEHLELQKPKLQISPLASLPESERDYARSAALELSRQSGMPLGKGSELFVFVFASNFSNKPDNKSDASTLPRRLAFGLKLFDFAGNLIHNFATLAPNPRYTGINIALNPGSYLLRLYRAGCDALEQTIVTCAGWQTQVCLPLALLSPQDKSRCPSLQDAAIFMAPIGEGFSEDADETASIEVARAWLARGEPMVNEELLSTILSEHCNPMLLIYMAHLLVIKPSPNRVLLREVSDNLKIFLGDHPDVTTIDLWLDPDAEVAPFFSPPMLRSSWSILVRNRSDDTLIPPTSYSQRITGQLWGSGVWLVWCAPSSRAPVSKTENSINLKPLFEYARTQLRSENYSELVRKEIAEKDLDSVESAIFTYVVTLAQQQIVAKEQSFRFDSNWLRSLKELFYSFVPTKREADAEKLAENRLLMDNILFDLHIPKATLTEAVARLFGKFELRLPKREWLPPSWRKPYSAKILQVGDRSSTVVYASSQKNHSGVYLEEGAIYNFETARDQKWNHWYIKTDADGSDLEILKWFEPFRRIPNENGLKLIGTVNREPDDKVNRALDHPIIIGKKLRGFKAEESGELILFANDIWGMYWNNSGAIIVTITKVAGA